MTCELSRRVTDRRNGIDLGYLSFLFVNFANLILAQV